MALLPSNNVWSRTHGMDEISDNTYNLTFALTATFGMVVYGVHAALFAFTKLTWWESLALFIVALLGCFVVAIDYIPFKVIGLSMISGGLGAFCGPYIGHFKYASVVDIAGATIIITLILGAIGWIYPKSLSNWSGLLLSALTALIIMQIIAPLAYIALGLHVTPVFRMLDWLGVLLFSAYIVFDFNRAQELPKTIDNAMDCGISVFLDIANLFIRLLSLFGQIDDD